MTPEFVDVPAVPESSITDQINAAISSMGALSNLQRLSAGYGTSSVHLDSNGLWIGGNSFETSPYRVTITGNQFHRDGVNDRIFIGNE